MDNLAVAKQEKLGNVDRIRFNNGMTLCIIPYNKVPLVSMVVVFKAGSIFESENLGTGLSHFVEHMAFKGTKKRTSQDFINEISKCGGYINAYTTYERTVYYTVVNSKYWDNAYDAISDAILNSTFDENEFTKEKEVVIKEMERAEENPQEVLWNLFTSTLYKTHPYRIPVGGFIDKIRQLTRNKLVEYFNSYYTPQKMCICIAGNINSENICQQTLKLFNSFFKENKELPDIPLEQKSTERKISFKNLPTIENNTKFMMGYKTTDIYSEDIPKIDVLSAVLGSGRSSKLVNRLVHKDNIATEVGVASFSGFYPGFLYISGLTKNTDTLRKTYDKIWNEYALLKNTLQEDELEKIKNNVIMSFYKKRETVQDMAMLGALAQFYMNDPLYDEKYVDTIKKIKLDDILQIMPKYINANNEVLSFISPQNHKIKNFILPNPVSNYTQASTVQPAPENNRQTAVEVGVLDGIKWIYEKDNKTPIVGFTISGLGGLKIANRGGLAHIASKMILLGTPTKSADSIAGVFERLGAYVDSSSHYDTYCIEATTLKEHFNTIFSLVWECLNKPIFPINEFKNLKNITRYQVQELYEDPFNIAYKNLRKAIFKNHPYRFSVLGEPSEIQKISIEDVKNMYKKTIKKNNIIVSVVGDINKDIFLNILSTNIAKYKLSTSSIKINKGTSGLKTGKVIIEKKKGISLPVIIIGFRLCDIYNKDKFTLSFVDSYLGGMSGTLFKKIREEKGLAYEISSFSNFSPDRGTLYIYARIDKKEEKNVRKDIEQILDNIKKNGVTESELTQFKNEMTGSVLRQIQRGIARARDYALYHLYGLGLDYTKKLLEEIEKINNDDIKRVANKYFDMDRAIISMVFPG